MTTAPSKNGPQRLSPTPPTDFRPSPLPVQSLIEHPHLNEHWCRDAIVVRWRGDKKLVPEDWKREGEGAPK